MDNDAAPQIPDDERREILAEIDERTELAPTKRSFAPKRRGVVFPLAVNLTAILLVTLAILVTARVFDRRRVDLQREMTSFTSAEGAIIEQVRRESAERLSAKEAEISKVRDELERIESERRALERTIDETVAARERVLRGELSQELEAERARLADTGRTESQIRAVLDDFQTRRLAALEAELTTVRTEARVEIQQRERALDAAEAAMREQLDAAQADRRRLLLESAEREAALEREVAQLEAQRERESLATNRLLLGFREIERSLRSRREADALDAIREMRASLVSGPDAALPVIAERRATDLFILDSLESLVRMLTAEEPSQSEPTVARDDTAETASPTVAEATGSAAASAVGGAETLSTGTAALAQQDPEAAFAAYRNALETGELTAFQERALEGLEQAFLLARDLTERSADAQEAELRQWENRIAELETELNQSGAEAAEARADAAADARAARSREDALRRRVAELERNLSTAEAEASSAQADLAAARAEIAAARAELGAAGRELAASVAEADRAERALAAAEAELAAAHEALAQARSEASRAAADVVDEIRRRVNAALRRAEGSALPLETSRPGSAEDVQSLATAIAADIGLLLAQRQSLEVVETREIRLVGTVVSVSDDAIALEPLATSNLEIGDMLWIRRRDDDGEIVVARAEVSRVEEGRIEARLSETATTPLVLDLVYAEVPSS